MASKTWKPESTGQCWASSVQLRRHTDPNNYHQEESRKRKCPSEGYSSAPCESSPSSTCGPPSRTGESLNLPLSKKRKLADDRPEGRTSRKRKSEDPGGPRKRRRNPSQGPDRCATFSDDSGSSSTASYSNQDFEGRTRGKRKSEDSDGPRKRRRNPSQGPVQHATLRQDSGTSSQDNTADSDSKDSFESQYVEESPLGEGGFGSVYAGYRIKDNLPVAIKHIKQTDVRRTTVLMNGTQKLLPIEVALLLQVKPAAPAGIRTVAGLLDWFDLDSELILVLERPVPCCDLVTYLTDRRSALPEQEAKVIAKQLVDALAEIHSRGVFHRDIKLDNILIETGSNVPRVWIIDFGYGTFLSQDVFMAQQGTHLYTSPEWFTDRAYRAEPATVWQLGVLLFSLLHAGFPFQCSEEIVYKSASMKKSLSIKCRSFLWRCLLKNPEKRATLEGLQKHPWLMPPSKKTLNTKSY